MPNVEVRIGLNDMLRLKKKVTKLKPLKRTSIQEAMRL